LRFAGWTAQGLLPFAPPPANSSSQDGGVARLRMSGGGRRWVSMRYNDSYASNLPQVALSSSIARIKQSTGIKSVHHHIVRLRCPASFRVASTSLIQPLYKTDDSQGSAGVTEYQPATTSSAPRLQKSSKSISCRIIIDNLARLARSQTNHQQAETRNQHPPSCRFGRSTQGHHP
jgi:hypothetical protein